MSEHFGTREEWLQAALPDLGAILAAQGATLPAVAVSCGWPSRGALSVKRKRLGECWHVEATADGKPQLFVSPSLVEPGRVLDVLLHETIHACVGLKAGHRAPFSRLAKAVGLLKPWTATTASPELSARLHALSEKLGPYPHAEIKPRAQRKKQGTRMLKAACPTCGYLVRLAQKWLDEAGPPICPTDSIPLEAT